MIDCDLIDIYIYIHTYQVWNGQSVNWEKHYNSNLNKSYLEKTYMVQVLIYKIQITIHKVYIIFDNAYV